MSGLPPPGYGPHHGSLPGYPSQGQVAPQPPSTFQQPKASPSHHSPIRSSPSHPSISRSPSHHSSPSHPSQHPLGVPGSSQLPGTITMGNNSNITTVSESDDQAKLRFQVEMEFVQSLANPNYLHFLAQRGFMKDPAFINYLSYLTYWKDPAYVSFLKYPVCLHFLELLQHETFRKEIVSGQCARFLDDQVILHWQHYTRRRAKLFEAASSGGQAGSMTGTKQETLAR